MTAGAPGRLPDEAYGAALVGLPAMSQRLLRSILRSAPPAQLWADLAGEHLLSRVPALGSVSPKVRTAWRVAARATDVAGLWGRCRAAGARAILHGTGSYPTRLTEDHQAPAVLFASGDLSALHGPTVTIVGTRRCTGYGAEVAWALGRALAGAGVVVVSGLAAGIDAAAQGGALAAEAAPVVGVGGSGIDVPYPACNTGLWRAVARSGVLLSEAPLGAPGIARRFPERNRILAALADVVVVVESHASGGSMHTVLAAAARGKPVMAVPGPVNSPASDGCNGLLADGCAPVRDEDDVLARLALERARPVAAPGEGGVPAPEAGSPEAGSPETPVPEAPSRAAASPGEPPTPDAGVLRAVDSSPTMFEVVLARTGMTPVEAAAALSRLEAARLVKRGAGWWERLGPLRSP